MKNFWLNRTEDESGVSGTGRVAQGVKFDNGKCAVTFLESVTDIDVSSVNVYDSIEDVKKIHGHGGKTKVEYE